MQRDWFRNPILTTHDRAVRQGIVLAGAFSVLALALLHLVSGEPALPYSMEMRHAAAIMDSAIAAIRDFRNKADLPIDDLVDPNRTGLIGAEYTELTTTLGDLAAKRTTTNPNVAALLVHLMNQAHVDPGDTVAIGCSASFPALMIASMSAARAMRVVPIVILSLGASSFGANQPDFNLLHMYALLREQGIITATPAAVSLGGEKDIGEEFAPALRDRLIAQIERSGYPLIHEPDFQKNMTARLALYQPDPTRGRIVAFINIGGSAMNLGLSELALQLNPGIVKRGVLPQNAERGVIHVMLDQGVPVIHLLYIRELASRYGLDWDPIPLPAPGEDILHDRNDAPDKKIVAIGLIYVAGLGVISFRTWRRKKCFHE
ncbi:MAG: poly-gamma-glutamate system protein [Candidatus Zhuqueibacterota bacterium]